MIGILLWLTWCLIDTGEGCGGADEMNLITSTWPRPSRWYWWNQVKWRTWHLNMASLAGAHQTACQAELLACQRGSLLQQTSHYFCLDHQRSIKRSKEITEDERRSKKILQQMSHYFSLDQQARFNKCISHKFFPWATIKTISSVRLTSRGHHETDTK